MKAETVQKLQSVLDQAVEKGEIAGGSLCVEEQGKEVCYIQGGYADLEKRKPIRRDGIYRLYSMSKPVTAAAAIALMEKGILDLAQPVSDYIPDFRGQTVMDADGKRTPAAREVTVKDLLNMTSGLMYPGVMTPGGEETDRIFEEQQNRLFTDHPMTTMELAKRLGQAPLAFHPGERWMYGSSADVLGAVLEAASGMLFGKLLEELFFRPLDMKDTGFFVPEEKRERLVTVYEKTEDGLKPYTGNHLGIINAMDREAAFESGGAGLVSTTDDFMKFSRMLLQEGAYEGKRILSRNAVRFLTQGELTGFQQEFFEKDFFTLAGYSYGNLMRVRKKNTSSWYLGSVGEYGWDGWLGTYMSNDPVDGRSILFMIQQRDAGTMPVTRKLRNVIYAEAERESC